MEWYFSSELEALEVKMIGTFAPTIIAPATDFAENTRLFARMFPAVILGQRRISGSPATELVYPLIREDFLSIARS